MNYGFKKFFNPVNFHGNSKKSEFFEGWYYKITSDDYQIAVIPGISIGEDNQQCFIQILDAKNNTSEYYTFPKEFFKYSKNSFEIKIGNCVFRENYMNLDLPGYHAEFNFSNIQNIPRSIFSPGVMGPYSYIPNMECNHGIIVINGKATGFINDKKIKSANFYMEKDWGKSFPSAWIWMQSNNFEYLNTSFTLSVANVPFRGKSFTGFIGYFLHKNKFYKFTSYNGSKIDFIDYKKNSVFIKIFRKNIFMEIKALSKNGNILFSPENGSMTGKISESLNSEIKVKIFDKNNILFSGEGKYSGLELVNVDLL